MTDTRRTATGPLLTIRDLRIEAYDGERWSEIVKGVDLTLKRGEVLGLIGESGAGKSTVGLGAMGYVRDGCRFSGGTITFDGTDLRKASPRQLTRLRGARIAYVAQSAAASFNPAHRIISQHTETARLRGIAPRAKAEEDAMRLYEAMRLPDPQGIGFRYPHQVSGGQLQRAMTAMAMSCRPDLIIFDEPTTALDVTTQIEVLAAIRDIVERFNAAAIYITHDLAVVAQMADRIKVLYRGKEVEEADTDTMLSSPRDDYTRSLWAVRSFAATPKSHATTEDAPLVRIQDVSASYGAVPVLHDVNLDIHRSRTVAIVGESGSGKSTLARVLMGLLPPREGQVLLDGAPLAPTFGKRDRDTLRRIQMIYQSADTSLNPKHRLFDLIGRPAELYLGLRGRALRERVRDLLAMIELEPDTYIDRLPSELSGGQRQRIGIARALAADPECIICDEVTSALDQIVAEGILRLLDRLQSELGLTYMFITHDLSTVRAIADDVVVMKDGRIVEQGPKEVVMTPPHDPYTELLLQSVPDMDPNWLSGVLEKRKPAS